MSSRKPGGTRTGTFSPGVPAARTGGTARGLADFHDQLDMTWDLYAMKAAELLAKLPREFQRFQPTN